MIGKTNAAAAGLVGAALIFCKFPTDADSVVCSNGGKSYSVPARWLGAGAYCFAVKESGTWTLTAKKGARDTATGTVTAEAGKAYSAELAFALMLYNAGDQCEEITGGWQQAGGSGTVSFNADNICCLTAYGNSTMALTRNKIDLTDISSLVFEGKNSKAYPKGTPGFGVSETNSGLNPGALPAVFHPGEVYTEYTEFAVDVSALSGAYYVCFGGRWADGDGSATEIAVRRVYGRK